MRVLGIISSPRRGGNSELAAKEILNTLPDSWEKAMININDLDIKTCTACYACANSKTIWAFSSNRSVRRIKL